MTNQEKNLYYKALEKMNLRKTSANFMKDWSSSTKFKIDKVVNVINNPLEFPNLVNDFDSILVKNNSQEIFSYLNNIVFNYENIFIDKSDEIEFHSTKEIFVYIDNFFGETNEILEKMWNGISEEEKNKLEYFLLFSYSEEKDEIANKEYLSRKKIIEYSDINNEEIINIISKIDFTKMIDANILFNYKIAKLENFIERKLKSDSKFFNHKKIKKYKGKYGLYCIGTKKNDIYPNQRISFILDPNGDDSYNSALFADRKYPLFALIDFGGNDLYFNKNIAELFSIYSGLGYVKDFSGHDVYQGGDYALSARFGFLNFSDLKGDDIYRTGLHSLGAASLGITLLRDLSGDDIYAVTEFGQGFGGTLACGILADYSGNDQYYSGGKYLHAPLAPLDYRSLSQGCGYGFRPDFAGGIGILFDNFGNDVYSGGVFAQGVGYWYSLGILIDNGGNDSYDAVYYPQGSGIHIAGGFLFDRNGEDHYYSKHGPGQGAGHDYATGFLIDRAGNDHYSIEGGNGLGLTNSVGIFLDVSGKDFYERRNEKSYGFANKARNSGGIGVFLDTGGNDEYPMEFTQNDTFWIKGIYGIGIDENLVSINENSSQVVAENNVIDIDSLAMISEIFSIASEWGVSGNEKRVEFALEILLSRDKESAEYIFQNCLDTKQGLTFRAIKNYSKKSKEFSKYYSKGLNHTDSLVIKNTILLISTNKDSTHFNKLESFLNEKKYVNSVLQAFGSFKGTKFVRILEKYIYDSSEKRRFIVARSLKRINTLESNLVLGKMKNDESFLIRTIIKL